MSATIPHLTPPPPRRPYVKPALPWPLASAGAGGPAGSGESAAEDEGAKIPTVDECLALWQEYAMLPHIGEHSRLVADVALALARRARELGLVSEKTEALSEAGGLLHDLAKGYCLKYGGSHAQLGASWIIASTRNRRLGQTAIHHVEWPWELPERLAAEPLAPVFFVLYGDKRARHNTLVGLAERYEDLLVRYGVSEAARASIARGREQLMTIESILSKELEFPLHESALAGGRLVKRT